MAPAQGVWRVFGELLLCGLGLVSNSLRPLLGHVEFSDIRYKAKVFVEPGAG